MSAGVVKSAERTLLVLELFAIWRKPATAYEVEAALDMPQSSTSVLLHSLVSLGYLEYDPSQRTYYPTMRVAMLSDWMRSTVDDSFHAERLDELRDLTGETVLLGRRQGGNLHYVQISRSGQELQFFVRDGTRRPLSASASGRALLSVMTDAAIARIVRSNNETAESKDDRVDPDVVMEVIRQVRETGISETDPRLGGERGIHAIATLLPKGERSELFSISIAGPRERVQRRRETLTAALLDWIRSVHGHT